MLSTFLRGAALLGLLVCVAPTFAASLSFTATGDGPRSEGDWQILSTQLAQDNADGQSAFLLHLGDIWKGSEHLPEEHYQRVAALLQTSKAPVYIVPGDNEWTDLKDPEEGWRFWTAHLLKLDEHWKRDFKVERQPGHEENIVWVQDGVLMIGFSMVGGDAKDLPAWHERHLRAAAWTKEQLTKHGGEVRAAVLFAQAKPKPVHEDYFAEVLPAVQAFAKPTMYLHGDGHKYEVESAWRLGNLTRVQVDQVEKARPLLITVTEDMKEPWKFDRRLEVK